jgi:regulator of cell morphogenesis and NO signaling
MSRVEFQPVGDWCSRRPLAVPVLYAHGIDASDPARSLVVCCRDAQVALAPILAEVAAAEAELTAPWRTFWPTELIDHIVHSYHRPLPAEIQELDAAIAAAMPPPDAPGTATWHALRGLVAELADDLEQHMTKEERVLFPWLRVRARTAAAPIRAMQLEHDDTLVTLHALHASAGRCLDARARGPREAAIARELAQLVRRLCEHIHLESNELFPRALDAARPPG